MTLLHRLVSILRWLVNRNRAEQDLHDEVQAFVEMAAADRMRDGTPPGDARRLAVLQIGGVEQTKERVRSARHGAWLDDVWRDAQYALRMIGRHPTFAFTVIVTLAVGVAASTALFTIVHNVLLRPLAIPEPDRVVMVYNSYPKMGVEHASAAAADYDDRLRGVTVFEDQVLFNVRNPSVDVNGVAERIHAMHVTASFFRLIRTPPAEGRAMTDEEESSGRNRVAVISAGLAQQLFGGDRAVGRDIRIDGERHEVLGVMPKTFTFIDADARIWLPLTLTALDRAQLHANNWGYLGRLKPGATVAQAQAQVDAVNAASLVSHPELREPLTSAGFHAIAVPLQDDLVREMRPPLRLLWAGALFVLLMGCVNVISLVVARSETRAKEIATRVALGAGRWRVARQLLTEHLILTLTAGAAGLALAAVALRAFGYIRLDHLAPGSAIRIDGIVVVYAFVSAAIVGIIIGIAPFVSPLFGQPLAALRDDARTGTSRRGRHVRRALVVTQVAVALMLMVGAGLLLTSFRRVLAVHPGFNTDRILTASVELPQTRYADADALRRFSSEALAAIRALPGTVAAGATTSIPFGSDFNTRLIMAEGYQPRPGESFVGPYRNVITPGYFEALGVPLEAGRFFTERDSADARRVVIVDTRLARLFWSGLNPLGRRLYFPQGKDLRAITPDTPLFEVVGVVSEVKLRGRAEGAGDGAYYFPQAQGPERRLTFAVHAGVDPVSLASLLRAAITRLDRDLPVFAMQPMAQLEEQSLASRRTATMLALAFGAVALLLSALGIYGVLAYLVTERTKEIGIRMALGSTPTMIVELVLREGLLLIACGFAVAAAGAPLLTRSLQGQLFGVAMFDRPVLVMVMATLVSVATVACALPARRAARIDPIVALRR
jgi:putative ABC transport system permease protein